MFRKIVCVLVLISLALVLFVCPNCRSCRRGDEEFSVALILGPGGKDDKSYNAMVWNGANRAAQEFGLIIDEFMVMNEKEGLDALYKCVKGDYDMVIVAPRFLNQYIGAVAGDNTGIDFLVFDSEVRAENVFSCIFDAYAGGYLVGVVSAMKSEGEPLGFIAPDRSEYIQNLYRGYTEGAEGIFTGIEIEYKAFDRESMMADEKAGEQLACELYDSGVKVIFAPIGMAGVGVFKEAKERGRLAVGCDANQNYIEPGYVLTSLVRDIDAIVYQAIIDAFKGELKGGLFYYGISGGWLDIAIDESNRDLFDEVMLEKVEQVKAVLRERV